MAKPWVRRIAPAVGLFFVAPLVSEFLLGDLPISFLGVLAILAPFYGGGALLIRETVRRTGRGWPSIFLLAFAYAVFEEAFTTQTLFNPNYLHLNLHLLDHAFIPALGIGAWWTIFVLTLHTVWSISTSIALVEALVPDRATTPWLGGIGLSVIAVLFVLASIASTAHEIKQDHFVASMKQFVASGIICVVVAIVAFLLPKRSSVTAPGWVPSPWLVGAGALLAGSIFMLLPATWGWGVVGAYVLLDMGVITAISVLSRRSGWDARHRLALAGGAALTYAWHGFVQTPVIGKSLMVARVGNVVFAASLIVLLVIAARKTASNISATPDLSRS
ncbi:MAG TPA: hypothetical protein VH079_00365 [Terriglobales bacterium]|nr:hypothetical protein [Terriglobales bacterium]